MLSEAQKPPSSKMARKPWDEKSIVSTFRHKKRLYRPMSWFICLLGGPSTNVCVIRGIALEGTPENSSGHTRELQRLPGNSRELKGTTGNSREHQGTPGNSRELQGTLKTCPGQDLGAHA